MAAPVTAPATTAEEFFPSDVFEAQAIDLVPLDAAAVPQLFSPFSWTVELQERFAAFGLVPPFEVLTATPSGVHERVEYVELPLVLTLLPSEPGEHRITLREQAHNRWYGTAAITVSGDRS